MKILEQRKAPDHLVEYAQRQIESLIQNVKGIDFAMICTTDGFELAQASKKGGYNASKLAAVCSSILAMVTAFLNEIQLTGCQSLTLDAENGKAVLTAINAPHHPMVLVTLVAKDVLLGQLLYALKETNQNIVKQDLASV